MSGIIMLAGSHAAIPYVSTEVENGVKTPGVVAGDSTGASGGSSIEFMVPAQSPTPTPPPSGHILFQDDFNGAAGAMFDQTNWHEYSSCGYRPSAAYGNSKCGEDERLDGQGHLIILATPTRGQSLMTGDNFKFEYGTMSAWMKMPPQVSYWPAFWTVNDPAISALASGGGLGSVDAKTDLSAAYHKYTAKLEPNRSPSFLMISRRASHSRLIFVLANPGHSDQLLPTKTG